MNTSTLTPPMSVKDFIPGGCERLNHISETVQAQNDLHLLCEGHFRLTLDSFGLHQPYEDQFPLYLGKLGPPSTTNELNLYNSI